MKLYDGFYSFYRKVMSDVETSQRTRAQAKDFGSISAKIICERETAMIAVVARRYI